MSLLQCFIRVTQTHATRSEILHSIPELELLENEGTIKRMYKQKSVIVNGRMCFASYRAVFGLEGVWLKERAVFTRYSNGNLNKIKR